MKRGGSEQRTMGPRGARRGIAAWTLVLFNGRSGSHVQQEGDGLAGPMS
jgi:hypothetical protein